MIEITRIISKKNLTSMYLPRKINVDIDLKNTHVSNYETVPLKVLEQIVLSWQEDYDTLQKLQYELAKKRSKV